MRKRCFLAAGVLCVLLHPCVYAQEGEGGRVPAVEAATYGRFEPASSVKAMSGEVELVASGTEVSFEHKFALGLPVKFSLSHHYMGIKNDCGVELPSQLVELSGDMETTFPFPGPEETYLRLGLSPSFYGDNWDFPSSAFRLPSRAFLIYIPDDQWTFICGAAVYPDFEKEVMPVLGFIYRPNEKLQFRIVPKRPQVNYALDAKTTLFAEGGGSFGSEFEVTQGAHKNVVVRYRETRLGLGVRYQPAPFIRGSVSLGGAFNRSFKYRESLGKVTLKDGIYAEFRLDISL